MTDEQIAKDLERYIDQADGFYATDVLKNALDLLKRQKAEIEKLQEDNKYLDDCLKTTYRIIGEMIGE